MNHVLSFQDDPFLHPRGSFFFRLSCFLDMAHLSVLLLLVSWHNFQLFSTVYHHHIPISPILWVSVGVAEVCFYPAMQCPTMRLTQGTFFLVRMLPRGAKSLTYHLWPVMLITAGVKLHQDTLQSLSAWTWLFKYFPGFTYFQMQNSQLFYGRDSFEN